MDITNMQSLRSVLPELATNHVNDDANVRVDPKRLHHPPVMRAGESSGSKGALDSLLSSAAWETLEDREQQAFLDGPPPPEKPRTSEQYRLLINTVLTRLLADKASGKDVLTNAMETIMAGVSAFKQQTKEQFDALMEQYEAALGELEGAGEQVKQLDGKLGKLEAQINTLKQKQAAMQQAGVTPDDPNYLALMEELTQLQGQQTSLQTARQAAQGRAEQWAAKATNIQSRLNDLVESALNSEKQSRLLSTDFIEEQSKAQFNLALRLLNFINQSIKDRAEETKLRAEDELKRAEFNTEMAGRARVAQAKKTEEQLEKSEQSRKKSDCISKIVNALLAVALAVVTMGAATVLSVALLVMTVADAIIRWQRARRLLVKRLSR